MWAGVASGAAPVDKVGLVGPDVLPGVGAVGHFGLCSEELKRESISGVNGKWSWENRGYGALTGLPGRINGPRRR